MSNRNYPEREGHRTGTYLNARACDTAQQLALNLQKRMRAERRTEELKKAKATAGKGKAVTTDVGSLATPAKPRPPARPAPSPAPANLQHNPGVYGITAELPVRPGVYGITAELPVRPAADAVWVKPNSETPTYDKMAVISHGVSQTSAGVPTVNPSPVDSAPENQVIDPCDELVEMISREDESVRVPASRPNRETVLGLPAVDREKSLSREEAALQAEALGNGQLLDGDPEEHKHFQFGERSVLRLKKLNDLLGWGFPSEQFMEAARAKPRDWNDRLVPVLVPYFSSLVETMDRLVEAIDTVHKGRLYTSNSFGAKQSVEACSDISHEPGLVWELVDLNSGPNVAGTGGCYPHAALLTAAAVYPEWSQTLGTPERPAVTVTGYMLHVEGPDGRTRQCHPTLRYDADKDIMFIGASFDMRRELGCRYPVVCEVKRVGF